MNIYKPSSSDNACRIKGRYIKEANGGIMSAVLVNLRAQYRVGKMLSH